MLTKRIQIDLYLCIFLSFHSLTGFFVYLGKNKISQKEHISVYFQIFEHDLSNNFNKVLNKVSQLYFVYKTDRRHDHNSLSISN
ncbi:hypothetical protein RIF29_26875 [Crotalaria pallida]|uniref:Uncharacterized protein n=1 Tax=Crotalaria pallida TaxID=3830 RepID=A0AAN9HYB4_CROPI